MQINYFTAELLECGVKKDQVTALKYIEGRVIGLYITDRIYPSRLTFLAIDKYSSYN